MKTIILLALLVTMPQRIIGFSINDSHNPVAQQPLNEVWQVSENPIIITQVWSEKVSGQVLVAHNYLAGKTFAELELGDIVTITLEDMTTQDYTVSEIKTIDRFTTMRNNPDYNDPDLLTMQTCIDDKTSILVIASKVAYW